MNDLLLKNKIIQAIWTAADDDDSIQSATIAGSFARSNGLAGVGDIDCILIVDPLNRATFHRIQDILNKTLLPILNAYGFKFLINATLGPIKFNEHKTAVLHLMPYSPRAHIDHCINSPFTVFDWQLSPLYRKRHLSEIYPVFGLQPRHFFNARRSSKEYLHDFQAKSISYRDFDWMDDGYREIRMSKPMTKRDRFEFAYHIYRFLMLNYIKFTTQTNKFLTDDEITNAYFSLCPENADLHEILFKKLGSMKQGFDVCDLDETINDRVVEFVINFEKQFLKDFVETSNVLIAFRHAPTVMNTASADDPRFSGRTDVPLIDSNSAASDVLINAVRALRSPKTYCSPLTRCKQSLEILARATRIQEPIIDARLIEMDYGECEGLSVSDARAQCPKLFQSWDKGDDPRFPGGENSEDVRRRALSWLRETPFSERTDAVVCAHNVVIREWLGEALGVPPRLRYRMRIPHMTPFRFIISKRFGIRVDIDESIERHVFSGFVSNKKNNE